MKKVIVGTYPITDQNQTEISARGCFKVKVRNDSNGPIVVAGLPILPQTSETFDGLHAGETFAENFSLDMSDSVTPEVYVTRYTYGEEQCATIPNC